MATKLATAPTKERLLQIISEYYCSQNYIITEDNKVFNTKLQKEMGEVKFKSKKFQFWAH